MVVLALSSRVQSEPSDASDACWHGASDRLPAQADLLLFGGVACSSRGSRAILQLR